MQSVTPVSATQLDSPTQIHLSTSTGDPSTEITFTWKTASSADSDVRLGTSPGVYSIARTGLEYSPFMSGATVCCFHSVQETGLSPDTFYYYQVGGDVTGWSDEFSFRSAPVKGSQSPFTFVTYGDMGRSTAPTDLAIKAASDNPSFVLHTGDVSYCTSTVPIGAQACVDDWYDRVIKPLSTRALYMIAAGNHEHLDPDDLFTFIGRENLPGAPIGTGCPSSGCDHSSIDEKWYSFDWGNTHIVTIELGENYGSYGLSSSDPRVQWFANDLSDARGDPNITWIIVQTHNPLYSTGKDVSHVSDVADREVLEPYLQQYKVDLVVQSHAHSYERTLPVADGGESIDNSSCVGSSGAYCINPMYPIYITQGTPRPAAAQHEFDTSECSGPCPWSIVRLTAASDQNWTTGPGDVGYGRVTVSGNQLRYQFVNLSGGIMDDVTISKTIYRHMVVRGTYGQIYYSTFGGSSWTGWSLIPGSTSDPPAAAACGGELHVAVRGAMDKIYYGSVTLSDGAFSGWTLLPGGTPSAPALAAGADCKLYLVVRGESDSLFLNTRIDGSWEGWQNLPGATIDAPAAAVAGSVLHVAVRGSSGDSIWHGMMDLSNSVWLGWSNVPGGTPSKPALAVLSPNDVYLAVRGLNDRLYANRWDGAVWTGWNQNPTGSTQEGPSIAVSEGKVYSIVQGSNGNGALYESSLSEGEWSMWRRLPGSSPSSPALTSMLGYTLRWGGHDYDSKQEVTISLNGVVVSSLPPIFTAGNDQLYIPLAIDISSFIIPGENTLIFTQNDGSSALRNVMITDSNGGIVLDDPEEKTMWVAGNKVRMYQFSI